VLKREVPFLRIMVPLCAGIITGLWIEPGKIFFIAGAIVISAGLLASTILFRNNDNTTWGFFLSIAFFMAGLIHFTNEKNSLTTLAPVPSEFICTLSDYPAEKEKSLRLEVKMQAIIKNGVRSPVNGSLMLMSRKEDQLYSLLPGDILLVRGTPQEIVNRGNPGEFDYKSYMLRQGIRYSIFTQPGNIIMKEQPAVRQIIHRSLIIRNEIIGMYRDKGITGDTLALVAAITLGQKNLLDPEQKEYFKKAGVMHIMAVSGLHAVILSYFIFRLLFFLGGRFNILRITIALVILWGFAFVTGLTPSVLRATLMFSFLQAGMLLKRPVNNINSVLASAFVLIMIKPSVLFDAGFQLSYSAVLFIICFYKPFYGKLSFNNRLLDVIWQMAAVTIIAQAGTLPLTVMLFNQFPAWFIASNILIVPLSSVLIIAGCLVPLTYPLGVLSHIIAWCLAQLTGITEMLTRTFAALPFSVIENIGISQIASAFLMLTIFLVLAYIFYRDSFPILFPSLSLLFFISSGTAASLISSTRDELIVYNSAAGPAIAVKTGNSLTLFADTICRDAVRHCAAQGLKIKDVVTGDSTIMVKLPGKNIMICSKLTKEMLIKASPQTIIFTSKPVIDRNIPELTGVKQIIFAASAGRNDLPERLVQGAIDTIHYVKKSGAFVYRL
jgi:competence protein ComEC